MEEYIGEEQQQAYAYDEAYQVAAQQMAAQAAANGNGHVGQYGAPSVHHDAQVRIHALACDLAAAPEWSWPRQPLQHKPLAVTRPTTQQLSRWQQEQQPSTTG